jgi:hypothetical protein
LLGEERGRRRPPHPRRPGSPGGPSHLRGAAPGRGGPRPTETTTEPTTVAPKTGATAALTPPTGASVTALFLAHLPRFLAHARFSFRRVGCPEARADRVAETLALAWKHFAALAERGRRPELFVTTLALRCSQAVRAGRRLAGCEGGMDVLSPVAQVRHGFGVVRLPDRGRVLDRHPLPDELAEALADNTRSAVPEQVAFRVDFPRWRASLRRRDRRVLDALAGGARTADAGLVFQSWWVFLIGLAVQIGLNVHVGNIRPSPRR